MNVLLIGATGTVGSAVREKLLQETDDKLTLFARHTSRLKSASSREAIIAGDVNSTEDLQKALSDQDVVFVALSGNLGAMAENIVNVMETSPVKRLIFITSMGIYDEIPNSVGSGGNLSRNPVLETYRKAADIIEASDLNYTIIRPGWFDNGTTEYEITHKGEPFGGHDVAVASIADLVKRLIHEPKLGIRESLGINRPE
ncbi:MAG: NAD(P)H-binding protein [Enterococcus sp.]